MSLLQTKPRWAPHSIATERGWTDPRSGEVYVSIKQLASRLAAEAAKTAPVQSTEETIQEGLRQEPQVEQVQEPVIETAVTIEEEVKMEETKVEEVKQETKRRGRPAKSQVITEVVEYPADTKIIGEVVETTAGQIIAE